MNRIGFIQTKGWQCTHCQGVYGKIEFIDFGDELKKSLIDSESKKTQLSCIVCNKKLNRIKLAKENIEIEYCPKDFGVYFDVTEDQKFIEGHQDKNTSYQNPKGMDYAIHVKYGGRTNASGNYLIALRNAKNDPEKIKKILDQINRDNSSWS